MVEYRQSVSWWCLVPALLSPQELVRAAAEIGYAAVELLPELYWPLAREHGLAIAAVNGHAIGLGCDLACLCDMRIAAESALFSCSFIKVGLVPGDGGAWSLARVVGYATAAELFFTGDRFDATRAKEIGLVARVVPDADLLPAALALAERIAANPARALRLTKRLLREAQTARMSEILELSAAYQALVHETADHKEAVAALLEKRSAIFTGN